MNECLTTLQHEKQIGYWVSECYVLMTLFLYITGLDTEAVICMYHDGKPEDGHQVKPNGILGNGGEVLPNNRTIRCTEDNNFCFTFWTVDQSNATKKTVVKQGNFHDVLFIVSEISVKFFFLKMEQDVALWYDGSSDRNFMVDPFNYISFQPVLHDWCNKGCGICYLVYGMMHIKEPLLLIEKNSSCCSSGFPLSLSGLLPYVHRHITVNKMC